MGPYLRPHEHRKAENRVIHRRRHPRHSDEPAEFPETRGRLNRERPSAMTQPRDHHCPGDPDKARHEWVEVQNPGSDGQNSCVYGKCQQPGAHKSSEVAPPCHPAGSSAGSQIESHLVPDWFQSILGPSTDRSVCQIRSGKPASPRRVASSCARLATTGSRSESSASG